MEEEALPDDLVKDHTAAQHKRPRSSSSTSAESIHSTRTLQLDDFQIIEENNREYGNDLYFMPCDQLEHDRLTIQHKVFLYALKGKLTTTNIAPYGSRILDLGTGPGDWAVAMALQYPNSEVVGVDMAVWDIETTEESAGATDGVPVTWEIVDLDVWDYTPTDDVDEITAGIEKFDPFRDDPSARSTIDTSFKPRHPRTPDEPPNPFLLEPPLQPGWNFSDSFDLIHIRGMKGVFADWEDVYAEVYKNLAPGGWVEVADYELMLPEMVNSQQQPGDSSGEYTFKSTELPLPTIRKLYTSGMQASWKVGRHLGTAYMHATYLEDAGFKDIKTTYVNVPVGTWPEDPEQKKIGKMFLVVLMESLETHLLRLLTQWGDAEKKWTAEEVRAEIEQGKREIFDWSESIASENWKEGWCASFKWIVGRKSKNAD